MKQAAVRAIAYAATSVLALHDPWSNAMRLMLAVETGDSAAQARAHAELLATVQRGNDGAHWEFDGYSPFYGWGSAGRLETTALALAAQQANADGTDETLNRDTLLYLLQARDGYGIWMSGQTTVRVLKALLPIAIRQLQSAGTSSFALTVNGTPLTGELADALKANNQILDAPRSIDLSSMLHAGAESLRHRTPQQALEVRLAIDAAKGGTMIFRREHLSGYCRDPSTIQLAPKFDIK